MQRQEQKGDTTVFNAAAFKVNPDATTEDLLKKMPGMQVKDGTVTQGGETVKKVLVDGKEFFGSDPMLALKNIDASMVDKIEVYDKQSDQAQFTGFSDGNEERTINILTKMGIKSGRFGRVYGGLGTDFDDDTYYEAGGNMNLFKDIHRFSVIGMLNNVNQLNFSFDDVTGAMANGGGRSMRGMGGGGRDGHNTTGAIGLNYNMEKEKKLKIETSYFFNYNKNTNASESLQEYFSEEGQDSVRTYNSTSGGKSHNYNHRASLRLQWTIDDNNSLTFSPSVSWQKYDGNGDDQGFDYWDDRLYQKTVQIDESKTKGYSLGGDINWRHRFSIPRRTISLRVSASANNSDSDGESSSYNEYLVQTSKNLMTSQETSNESRSIQYGAKLMYTEPFGEHMALQVNYSPSYKISKNDKQVYADSLTTLTDTPVFSNYRFSQLLSNKKESDYLIHRAGVGLNIFKGKELNATLGLDFQKSILDGEQTYPLAYETSHSYTSLMPSAELRINKNRTLNVRLTYRTSSSAPSISQLQNVVDVSNIRRYSTGNDDLSQSTTHELRTFLSANRTETSRFIFFNASASFTNDYIATSSVIATKDSTIDFGILLPAGTQFSKPLNMDGKVTARANVTLSTPVSWLGSNFSLNLGTSVNKTPSMYNYKKVTSRTNTVSGGVNLSSSFSENVDFNIGYDAAYNIVKSTQTVANNYNYYSHTIRADLTWLFANQRIVFTNNLSHKYTYGMGDNYDSNYLSWNASLGGKLFKDKRGELKVRVNDILNSTESTRRSIQTAYVQTSTTDVLRRYAMLTFTYKFKSIGTPQVQEGGDRRGGFGGPGGGRGNRPGGGGFGGPR